MPICVLSGRTRNMEKIINRTEQSGGSIGGDKKPGIVTYGTTWQRGNMGNFLKRAPQRMPTRLFLLLNTTRHPVQRNRNGYSISHSGTLLG